MKNKRINIERSITKYKPNMYSQKRVIFYTKTDKPFVLQKHKLYWWLIDEAQINKKICCG